ncbi:MAG: hypothetical protein LBB94_04535 [Clostridiales bacterium]|jgi:hypothetical protein|nr:hypothetical protein [Clostridiales bacterium]
MSILQLKKKLSFILAAAIYLTGTNKVASAAEDTWFTVKAPFSNTETKEFEQSFLFSERFFPESGYIYQHELAKASLGMAVAAFSSLESMRGYGVSANIGREKNISAVYKSLGFENCRYFNYDAPLNDSSAKVAFSIASKPIKAGNYTLVAVVPRGGGYGAEWGGNFVVGDGVYHESWYGAARGVVSALTEYIRGLSADSKVKIWLTGYSRGGAVANLAAAMLDKPEQAMWKPEDIYAYTFAAPRPVVSKSSAHPEGEFTADPLFDNIYNIINPADPYPNLPLANWGFNWYGVSYCFQTQLFSQDVSVEYRKLTEKEYNPDLTAGQRTRGIEETLMALYPDKALYVKKLQPVLSEFATFLWTKQPDADGNWVQRESMAEFFYRYGDKGKNSYNAAMILLRLEEAVRAKVKAVTPLSSQSRETIALFSAFCQVNGFTPGEMKRIITVLAEYFQETGADGFALGMDLFKGTLRQEHYPEVYIACMRAMDAEQQFARLK